VRWEQESKNVRWTRLVRLVHGPSIEVPQSFWNSNLTFRVHCL